MPMNKSNYPPDWKTIAFNVKGQASWCCQECGRPCRMKGVEWLDFVEWLLSLKGCSPNDWYSETYDEIYDDTGMGGILERPQRFTLTVAHLDHNPMNCSDDNLKALCSGCHLRYDKFQHAKNASATRAKKKLSEGQLKLLI